MAALFNLRYFFVFILISFGLLSCKKEELPLAKDEKKEIPDAMVDDNLKINQIQYLGSHNSYRSFMPPEIFDALLVFQSIVPYNLEELDYKHIPIEDQLTDYGIRQLEIDVYADMNGGRFYNRMGYTLVNEPTESNIEELNESGTKVLHIPDIDFNAHQLTFQGTLENLKSWSNQYPQHLPIFVLIETKSEDLTSNSILATIGYTEAEPWTMAALAQLESEIETVFSTEDLITPSQVQGNFSSINEAVLQNNWPTVGDSRGKFVFFFNNNDASQLYNLMHPTNDNKLIFEQQNPGHPNAAFILRNNPSNGSITNLVDEGYMVRTRADAGTYQARNGDYSDWNSALSSGAHFLSTDYYKPDERAGSDPAWTDYSVGFTNGLYRNNPITGN